ncbi:prefoldin subunit alpha [Candidatus Micrarchaeota archaeon]|nr:prefoldin subunit alpha [Candidatus Micrarchaeota archaeon]
MSKDDSGQKKLNQLAFEAQSCQQQGQAMQQQISSLQSTSFEARATIETLKNIQNVKNKKVLLPIGSGVLVNSEVEKADKILIEVGSGIMVEKHVPDAISVLEERLKKIDETRARLQDALMQVSDKLRAIDKDAKEIMAKMDEK